MTAAPTASPGEVGWVRVVHCLQALASPGANWDGCGVGSPPPGVVSTAVELAWRLRSGGYGLPAGATATPAGTILFEWHGGGIYAEMEVVSPASVEWMTVGHDDVTTHGSFTLEDASQGDRRCQG